MKIPAWKIMVWLVKREFWEHRGGFFLAPLISSGVFVALNIMLAITREVVLGHSFTHDVIDIGVELSRHKTVGAGEFSYGDFTTYVTAGLVVMLMAIIVFFYCLGSLYDDRRDRSVLFWQSLPISNRNIVLAKVISATLVAPTIACVLGTIAGLLVLFTNAVADSLHGFNLRELVMISSPLRVTVNLITSIPLYALWALPTVGWLMACSAWARNKPFLWALLAPLAAGVIVSWFRLMGLFNLNGRWFWTNIVARLFFSVAPGDWIRYTTQINGDPAIVFQHIGLAQNYAALTSPDLWIGAIAGIVLISAAIWFRGWRDNS